MFDSQESTPWYRSSTGLIAVSVLLPPVGIVLLWMRRDSTAKIKILGTLCIVLLGVGYFYLYSAWRKSSLNEDHYAELERHRAQQQSATGSEAAQPGAPTAAAPANAAQQPAAGKPAVPGAAPAEQTAAAHASRNYWTNFRGPNRDGRYDEMAVLTEWPAGGLSPVWKQPIGVGYASFVVADGRAYTIEQRRRQEVVAAYDVSNGRELWTQGWNAEYTDSTGDGPRTTPTWDDGRLYALGRNRRASLSGCEDRRRSLGKEHSQRQRRLKFVVGDGRFAAHR